MVRHLSMRYLDMKHLRLGAIALIPLIFLTSCRLLDVSPGVRVSIANESGKDIETIEFWSEQANQPTPTLLESIGPLEAGEKHKIILSDITGEGAYFTQVTFEDGEQIEGGAGYVEGGYRVIETIGETEITSEIDFY